MLRLLLLLALLGAALVRPACAQGSPAALCRSAIAMAERAYNIPDRLMQAIGIVESGRPAESGRVSAWPWTINVEGTGYAYDTKAQAIAAVNQFRADGARSIDVGCMQVNLMYHGQAFASLDQAFDPLVNARYAAQFLRQLLDQTGSWPRAAAGYHSMTPTVGADYARKVLTVWAQPGLGTEEPPASLRRGPLLFNVAPPVTAFTSPVPQRPGTTPPANVANSSSFPRGGMPADMAGRVLLNQPAASARPVTGRGLASYRSAPTRLATVMPYRGG